MKLLILHNIASSYYRNLIFNSLDKMCPDFIVIHLSETEDIREWNITPEHIQYPHEILSRGSINNTNQVRLSFRLLDKLKTIDPDTVYLVGYNHLSFWLALVWAKARRKKVIIEMNTNRWDRKRYAVKEFFKRMFIGMCDLGLVYADSNKTYLKELGMREEKIIKKPNVTMNVLFEPTARFSRPDEFMYPRNILFVGRLSWEKNILFALDAFRVASCRIGYNHRWGFVIVGSGPLEEEIKSYIKTNNMENVFLPGFKQMDELKPFYWNSDILVLPSVSEPWGLVVNEAMAAGLPVIVSDRCGAAYELVREGENGFIIDPFDRDGLVKVFTDVMGGKLNLQGMGERSRKIIGPYTPEAAAAIIMNAHDLLQERDV